MIFCNFLKQLSNIFSRSVRPKQQFKFLPQIFLEIQNKTKDIRYVGRNS